MKFALIIFAICCQQLVIGQAPTKEWQIRTAVLPLAEDLRSGATVLGYDEKGEIVTLRKGTNDMICLADDPTKSNFSVAAYHKSLEPFMIRGRELKKQGMDFQAIFDQREKEVRSGELEMPDKTTLYVLSGDLDANNEPVNTKLRFVVYIPFATAESTGLPTFPLVPGAPWIMNPGTHRAHIMINPNYETEEN
ncbi:hypothetical protein [Marinoscillum pacificum]|uniref:hypothetical protein n=1 Tax=Marinoscillum pacificum TaxID=392723 RepID=UPI002157CB1F|nr:hypothetical protein [Marinoscillum pacificum]